MRMVSPSRPGISGSSSIATAGTTPVRSASPTTAVVEGPSAPGNGATSRTRRGAERRPAALRARRRPAILAGPRAAGFALRAVFDPGFGFVISLSEARRLRLVAVAALPTGMARGGELHLAEPPLLELALPGRFALGEPGELLVDLDAVVAGVLVYRPGRGIGGGCEPTRLSSLPHGSSEPPRAFEQEGCHCW